MIKELNGIELKRNPFTEAELSFMRNGFSSHDYYPYEHMSEDNGLLKLYLVSVPYFIKKGDSLYVCNGIDICIDKVDVCGVTKYSFTSYLSGLRMVDKGNEFFYISTDEISKDNLSELMEELYLVLVKYKNLREKYGVKDVHSSICTRMSTELKDYV